MSIIDLRSDTVTKPSLEMRKAMYEAEVGDDVYGEDPTINELQEYMADLLGKESALFVPSGTMGNQLCLKTLTQPGDEIIIEQDAHIYYYETAAPSFISNIQLRPLPSEKGEIPLDLIESSIRAEVYYFPTTSVISLENTHNRHGGTVLSLDYIKQVKQIVEKHQLKFHLDGARLWNAAISTKLQLKDYASYFDTVNVCFSKALGAPIGSMIAGSKTDMLKAHKWRKILGGGLRQAGIIAAACLYAVKNNFQLLERDHANAKMFASALNNIDEINCTLKNVETNMVIFKLAESIKDYQFVELCSQSGLLLSSIENNNIRCVFHLDIEVNEVQKAVDIIKKVIKQSNS